MTTGLLGHIMATDEQRRSFFRGSVRQKRGAFSFLKKGESKKNMSSIRKEGDVRIPSGCAVAAVLSRTGRKMTGEQIASSMAVMRA